MPACGQHARCPYRHPELDVERWFGGHQTQVMEAPDLIASENGNAAQTKTLSGAAVGPGLSTVSMLTRATCG
ncbi:protein of unknown function [Bradyrhizobium vignae]|uniref:Uncharacterized protein n=1 Tax=Bradyrhizobium vignae TaxID=1549949 RepID=A0A2U3QA04_9BRAD|nr:protein of unknown function [Bradyrhizobium vignae]